MRGSSADAGHEPVHTDGLECVRNAYGSGSGTVTNRGSVPCFDFGEQQPCVVGNVSRRSVADGTENLKRQRVP